MGHTGSIRRFSARDMALLSIIAAASIVSKPYVRIPFGFIQTAFGIPVGAVIGGVYMFWPVIAGRLVPKPGAVFVTCFLQGVLAVITGFTGLLGNMAFFSYLAPGIVIEVLYYVLDKACRGQRSSLYALTLAGALGNVSGAATNAFLFFAIQGSVFTFALLSALLSGAAGGWLAFVVAERLPSLYVLRPGEGSKGAS
jgi:ABC-type thiamin/hydroxymethylpyrimidine transport system permease subunit